MSLDGTSTVKTGKVAAPADPTKPPGYLPKNIIPPGKQIGHTLLALFLLGYGTYGAYVDELIVPGKRHSLVLHGWSVWVLYAAMACAALVLLSVVVDNFDPRDDERYYHLFAQVFQGLGWCLFFTATLLPIFIESPPREIARFKSMAERGDAEAAYQVGRAYANAEGVSRDYALAMAAFRKAAEQGNTGAMNSIGIMYFHGQGVAKDLREAASWYRKSAELGFARAQNNLGLMYMNDQIEPVDHSTGANWLGKAAEQGYARALFNLGDAFTHAKGVEQDLIRAHMLYTLAGEAGFESGPKHAKNLEGYMSSSDILEAQELAGKWRPRIQIRK